MGTLANSEDQDEMPHYPHNATVHQGQYYFLFDKIDLQRNEYNIFFEIITCDPSLYTIDHPKCVV